MNLTIFNQSDFLPALRAFFAELQVPINAVTDAPIAARDILTNTYKDNESFWLIDDVYFLGMVDDAAFRGGKSLSIDKIKSDYDGIIIFGVTLQGRDGGLLPTRSQLAEISRAFNREFCYTPVVVVFKYGEFLAFANTERSKFKRNQEGEKAGKVTLLRDIDIRQPHSGHAKILADLKIPTVGKDRVDSFDSLYKYWQKVLDVSLLNKKFYQEVSYWYLDACKKVIFPKDAKSNQDSLIRLITRLMFVWFLKEKQLVPDALFHREDLQGILKSLEPQDSSYYKAILQNLFFATLNTEWGERRFRKRVNNSRDRAYMFHNEFRYANAFVDGEGALAAYFKEVPFLNGGLFECLDRRDENEPEVRIDGFSDHADNSLFVPNELFFGELQDVDLNADFGTSRKKYPVRGLIEIFNSYKFTIAENTPLEEDVALDPELLGQVFENLLAAYNPETQTTARKQTGSFYTPREIVNYMVDESLIAYLENTLIPQPLLPRREKGSKISEFPSPKEGEWLGVREKLRDLFSYSDEPHQFKEIEIERLIQALDSCKILDPACGSGAFPMGVLQKMVHILKKLDPCNVHWKKQQKEKAIAPLLQDIQFAEKISYEEARDKAIKELRDRLKEIEASFENEMDYPRKLFLIQNCIYGVDIQAIAVQIAKLRCFISLIIDQREERSAVNRGILPLPNLETKFVAANSLIGVEKVQQLSVFVTDEISGKQKELEKLRREHFYVSTFKTKRAKRQRDRVLRQEISQILKRHNYPSNVADLLSNWEPSDPNFVATFFDPEWMFGIADGFDIVIGNPPYVRQEQIKELKPTLQKQFSCYTGVADLFVYFFERGYQLLNDGGVLSYICSNKYFRSGYGEKLRDFLGKNTTIQQLVDFGDTDVFTAIAYPSIILFSKEKPSPPAPLPRREELGVRANLLALAWDKSQPLTDFAQIFATKAFKMPQSELKADGWRLESTKILDLLAKLRNAGKPLGEYVNGKFYTGIKTGLNEAFIIKKQERDNLVNKDSSSLEVIKPFLRGKDIRRWQIKTPEQYIIFANRGFNLDKYPSIKKHLLKYQQALSNRATIDTHPWYELQQPQQGIFHYFDTPKIVYPDISPDARFSLDTTNTYIDMTAFIIASSNKYLLGILNSSVSTYYLSGVSSQIRGSYLRYKSQYVSQIPIPTATEAEQKAIETLVGYVLHLTTALKDIPSHGEKLMAVADDKLMLSYFEQIIDAVVMELYLPEELHAGDKYFMRHLLQENLQSLDKIKGDKIEALRIIFRRIFDREHPIRVNIYFLNSLEVVRIITGKP